MVLTIGITGVAMHRLITAAIAALLTTSLLAPPAHAAEVVIVSRSGNQAGDPAVFVASTVCGDPGQVVSGGFTYDRVTGPGAAPRGAGSLRLVRQDAGLISGLASIGGRDLNDLAATFEGSFRSSFGGTAVAFVAQLSSGWHGGATVPLTANTWTSVDFTQLPFTWTNGIDTESNTIAGFIAVHGAGTAGSVVGAADCENSTTGTVFVDDLRIGAGTDTQIFDFEPLLPTAVTATASKSTITIGGSVKLSTTLTSDGTPLASRPVELFHKPFGQSSYTTLGTVDTNASGIASLTLFPKKNTSYQWRYGGDTQEYDASQSPIRSVGVRARVTIALADATLKPGQTLVVTGKVTPAKTGFVATLWRKTATGKVKLASTTMVRADGSYRIAKTLTAKGTYKLFVTVPAAQGNLAGSSPIRTATVG